MRSSRSGSKCSSFGAPKRQSTINWPPSIDAAEEAGQPEGVRPLADIAPADLRVARQQQPVGAGYQVLFRHEADAAIGGGDAAVEGVVAVVAHHEIAVRRHDEHRRVVM